MAFVTDTVTNPNVAANTPISFANKAITADKIMSAVQLDTGDYPGSVAVPPIQLTVVAYSTTLAANQIALASPSQFAVGNATTDGYTTIVLTLREMGTEPKTTYSTAGASNTGPGY
jgi:hypothetical protein